MHRPIIPGALLLLLLTLLACGESSNTGTAVTSSTATSASAKPAQHYHVGDTVQVGALWTVTITSVKTSSGSQYFKPTKPDHLFLIVAVTVSNTSPQEQSISSLAQFHLQDASGQVYDTAIFPDAGATLDGKVEAGSPRKGILAYDIPNTVHALLLSFEANVVEAGQVVWDLKV